MYINRRWMTTRFCGGWALGQACRHALPGAQKDFIMTVLSLLVIGVVILQMDDDWIARRLERWGRRDGMPFLGPKNITQ